MVGLFCTNTNALIKIRKKQNCQVFMGELFCTSTNIETKIKRETSKINLNFLWAGNFVQASMSNKKKEIKKIIKFSWVAILYKHQ